MLKVFDGLHKKKFYKCNRLFILYILISFSHKADDKEFTGLLQIATKKVLTNGICCVTIQIVQVKSL